MHWWDLKTIIMFSESYSLRMKLCHWRDQRHNEIGWKFIAVIILTLINNCSPIYYFPIPGDQSLGNFQMDSRYWWSLILVKVTDKIFSVPPYFLYTYWIIFIYFTLDSTQLARWKLTDKLKIQVIANLLFSPNNVITTQVKFRITWICLKS